MISEGSPETGVMMLKIQLMNYILTYIHTEKVILLCHTISRYYCIFYCILSRKYLFQNIKIYCQPQTVEQKCKSFKYKVKQIKLYLFYLKALHSKYSGICQVI